MYVAHGVELMFDYGPFAGDFRNWPKETSIEQLKIDGKTARIGTGSNVVRYAGIFHKKFPYSVKIHIELEREDSLSMWANCKSQKDMAVARYCRTRRCQNPGFRLTCVTAITSNLLNSKI